MIVENILGTDYEFKLTDMNCKDSDKYDGWCKNYEHEIMVRDPQYLDGDTDEAKQRLFQHVILHELTHAYMGESSCPHNTDEALVDWIAYMIPKIVKTYDSIINKLKEENADENQD